MKFAKVLAATTLTLATANAMAAFSPPYHINGTAITGIATFKSAGACKVAPKKFENAKYGTIHDSTNASVGTGVIDATGNHILAVANPSFPQVYTKYDVDTVLFKIHYRLMMSFIDNNVLGYIAAQAGCVPGGVWATPTSYLDLQQDGNGSGAVVKYTLKQGFVGNLNPTLPGSCEQPEAGVIKCNLKKFTGGMTFKGEYIVP